MGRGTVLVLGILCISMVCGCGQPEPGIQQDLGAISVRVPPSWEVGTLSSRMRKAQYLLPRHGGDEEDASMVVYHFGPSDGGSVDANLERWYGQFTQPDGRATADVAKVSERRVSGMPVTVVDVTGTFATGAMGPMMPAGKPKPGYRMLAAIVTSPASFYYFKLTGPEQTVAHWRDSFDGLVNSIEQSQTAR